MEPGRLKLAFDEHFSERHVRFVSHETELRGIQHIRGLGWKGKPDEVWMPIAIAAGFVIVTGDRNDITRGFTTDDLKEMGACVIYVGPFWDHMGRWDRAYWLVRSIHKIYVLAKAMGPGTVIQIGSRCKARAL